MEFYAFFVEAVHPPAETCSATASKIFLSLTEWLIIPKQKGQAPEDFDEPPLLVESEGGELKEDLWEVQQEIVGLEIKICETTEEPQVQSNFGISNFSFSNPSGSLMTDVGPEFSAICLMHF